MTGRVAWISLTPVKALAIETVDEVEVLEHGLRGDRRFFLVDENGRLVNNKGRRSALQLVHATYDEPDNLLTIRFADGAVVSGHPEAAEELTTSFHRRPFRARRTPGPWDDAISDVIAERVQLVAPEAAAPDRGREGATTLLSTGSLRELAGRLDVDAVDARRFRMSFGIDGPGAHEEDRWIGRRVRVGEAVVVPRGNVGRCAITTQNPDTGRADLDTLKALAAYRGDMAATEPLPFGVHAAVAEPGRVRVGDPVELL
ncbi:MAG TPA: MOSC N-terminal beta barrel domain-containing protein [Gaiellaceae bacterium]|nr:MOSC N-terminal beta barrel domain-containing protein [Gaiellaceae bacterium]